MLPQLVGVEYVNLRGRHVFDELEIQVGNDDAVDLYRQLVQQSAKFLALRIGAETYQVDGSGPLLPVLLCLQAPGDQDIVEDVYHGTGSYGEVEQGATAAARETLDRGLHVFAGDHRGAGIAEEKRFSCELVNLFGPFQ